MMLWLGGCDHCWKVRNLTRVAGSSCGGSCCTTRLMLVPGPSTARR